MELPKLNPYVRYMDRRVCRYSYKTPVTAYEYRLFYLLDGECGLCLEGTEYALRAGDCLMIPGGRAYRFSFREDAPAEQYVVNFDMDCAHADVGAQPPDPPACFDEGRLIRPRQAAPLDQTLCLRSARALEEPLARLMREHEGGGPYRDELCSALLKEVLLRALRLSRGAPTPLPEPVAGLLEYLNGHYCERITGESLSRRFNYHAYYLGKRFREAMGVGIHQYVLSLRLKKCERLLISSTMSVTEIAAQCGFSSASHLAEAFRRAYRQSPGAYRERGRMA